MASPIFRSGFSATNDHRNFEATHNVPGSAVDVSGGGTLTGKFRVSYDNAEYTSSPAIVWPANPATWLNLSVGPISGITGNPEGHNTAQDIVITIDHTTVPLAPGNYSQAFSVTAGATGPAFTITGTVNLLVVLPPPDPVDFAGASAVDNAEATRESFPKLNVSFGGASAVDNIDAPITPFPPLLVFFGGLSAVGRILSSVSFVAPDPSSVVLKGAIVPVTVTVSDPDSDPAVITTEIYWSPTGILADRVLIGSTPAGGPHTILWDTTLFASGKPGALFARAIDEVGPSGYTSLALTLDAVPYAPVITSPTTGQIFGPLDIIPITWTASTDPDNLPATLKYSVQFSIDSGTNFNDVPGLTFDGGAGVGLTAFGAITISTLALPINNVIVRVAAWDGFFMSAYASVSFRIPVVLDQSSISFVDPVTDVIIELLAWEWTDPVYEGWSSQPRARFFDGNLTRITQIQKADPKRQHLTGSGTFMPDTVAKRIIAIMSGTDITQQWHRLKIVWVDLWGNQWTIRIVKMLPTWQPGLMEYHWEFDFVVITPPAVFKTGCE